MFSMIYLAISISVSNIKHIIKYHRYCEICNKQKTLLNIYILLNANILHSFKLLEKQTRTESRDHAYLILHILHDKLITLEFRWMEVLYELP